jgi:hypothetical protein
MSYSVHWQPWCMQEIAACLAPLRDTTVDLASKTSTFNTLFTPAGGCLSNGTLGEACSRLGACPTDLSPATYKVAVEAAHASAKVLAAAADAPLRDVLLRHLLALNLHMHAMRHQEEVDALKSLVDSLNASQELLQSASSGIDSLADLFLVDTAVDNKHPQGRNLKTTKSLPQKSSLGASEQQAISSLLQSPNKADMVQPPSWSAAALKIFADSERHSVSNLLRSTHAAHAQGSSFEEPVTLLALYQACDSPSEQRDLLLDQFAATVLGDACASLTL